MIIFHTERRLLTTPARHRLVDWLAWDKATQNPGEKSQFIHALDFSVDTKGDLGLVSDFFFLFSHISMRVVYIVIKTSGEDVNSILVST